MDSIIYKLVVRRAGVTNFCPVIPGRERCSRTRNP